MQLSRRARQPGTPARGFVATGAAIVRKETPMALYKGLGAVLTGIVPKMAIRFTSFEAYKQTLADAATGKVSGQATFLGECGGGRVDIEPTHPHTHTHIYFVPPSRPVLY
jgi:solute carrier family 25 citrate transporter 1